MTIKNRKTEEQKALEAEAAAARLIKQKEDAGIMTRTFATEDGRKALKMIMARCKYQSPISYLDNLGKISPENLIHNAATQGLYLWLRKQIHNPEILISVEIKETPDE